MTRPILFVASLAAVLLASACGSSSSSSSSSSAAAGSGGQSVTADEVEYKITLGSATVPAGSVTFQVSNTGTTTHNLAIEGPGISHEQSPDIQAGQKGTLTVDLKPGTYTVFCAIPGHEALGMKTTLSVQ
jgi:uncharacterized cupredoxin-like copper-binding protein